MRTVNKLMIGKREGPMHCAGRSHEAEFVNFSIIGVELGERIYAFIVRFTKEHPSHQVSCAGVCQCEQSDTAAVLSLLRASCFFATALLVLGGSG